MVTEEEHEVACHGKVEQVKVVAGCELSAIWSVEGKEIKASMSWLASTTITIDTHLH